MKISLWIVDKSAGKLPEPENESNPPPPPLLLGIEFFYQCQWIEYNEENPKLRLRLLPNNTYEYSQKQQ